MPTWVLVNAKLVHPLQTVSLAPKAILLNVPVVLMDTTLWIRIVLAPKDVLITVKLVQVQLFALFVDLVTQLMVKVNAFHAYRTVENAQELSKDSVLNVEMGFIWTLTLFAPLALNSVQLVLLMKNANNAFQDTLSPFPSPVLRTVKFPVLLAAQLTLPNVTHVLQGTA